jgi:DNA invertase Pin-like site-specific DNA recombinase
MQHKAAQGEYTGGDPPFGYRVGDDGVKLTALDAEQAIIEEARRLRSAGLSLRAVATALDARGHRSRSGRSFGSSQVRRLVST